MRLQHRIKQTVKPVLFRSGPRVRTVKLGPARGCRLLFDRVHDLQREFGLYESELHRIVRRCVRGQIVYDIGAADGYTALMYARQGATKVYAFELDETALTRLHANLRLNPTFANRIEVVPRAFSSDGVDIETPGFAKIDVDGREREVIAGIGAVKTLLVETHGEETERDCIRDLEARGHRVAIIPNAGWRKLYPEWRPIGQNRWLLARLPQ
jgi:hypothetical protein